MASHIASAPVVTMAAPRWRRGIDLVDSNAASRALLAIVSTGVARDGEAMPWKLASKSWPARHRAKRPTSTCEAGVTGAGGGGASARSKEAASSRVPKARILAAVNRIVAKKRSFSFDYLAVSLTCRRNERLPLQPRKANKERRSPLWLVSFCQLYFACAIYQHCM